MVISQQVIVEADRGAVKSVRRFLEEGGIRP